MDVLLRTTAIIIELLVLGAVFYYILNGARLTLFDLGVKLKYAKVINMAFIAIGCLLIVFFISHLISFYPPL